MMLATIVLIKWMLGCAASVVVGLSLWAMLSLAARRWPALQASRAAWLSALTLSAAATLLPVVRPLLQSGVRSAVSIVHLRESAPAPGTLDASAYEETAAAPNLATGLVQANPAAPAASAASVALTLPLSVPLAKTALAVAVLWLAIYSAGLALAMTRLLKARRQWRGLLATAQRLSPQDLAAHGAFSSMQLDDIASHNLAVFETSAAISPMLIGMRQPRLLLPAHLRTMSTGQQHMIIHHELRHWRQRDPLCLGIAAVLQTALWFNPALRRLSRAMEWAMELSCDQHVLAGRPQQQRKQYAAALLQQWQMQSSLCPTGGVAFGGIDGATVTSRLRWMQQTKAPSLSKRAAWIITTAMAAVIATATALQPALAITVPADAAKPATPATLPPPATTEAWRYPLDDMRVTSFFGIHSAVLTGPHHGIDLKAAAGTPVHAVASGTIISAGPLAEHDGRYGIAVIIDHGGQRSLYAHLSSVAVQPGEKVAAGQLIGASGGSGFATGPHLHFEVRLQDQPVDPATMLAGLDSHATPRALRVRRQQRGY